MNLLPAIAPLRTTAPGDYYLVDVGELVPVAAVSPRSAFHIAMTGRYGHSQQCPSERPMVYQLDQDGELLAVYE
jgi:hypothetical protein